MHDYFICPVCGEDVKVGALSCPACGACEKTGLKGDDSGYGLDLPDDEFDYDSFVKKEFEGKAVRSKKERIAAIVAVLLIVALLLYFVL
ncbi:hypothetical protein [Rubellicoccus peritrichatus]|uniref:Zinc ribbon domain-containing protein n=1 Tax=Rubellicoccus peritrichatus TaxID=3080537 RepID=A0AAQ3LA31_9BACT|nr:hypothetical protein [Puniceicoccus sp. CR14]WOO42434.1 hypothetical protein RZN69_04980 [Puniceicoccus sp. CR14]